MTKFIGRIESHDVFMGKIENDEVDINVTILGAGPRGEPGLSADQSVFLYSGGTPSKRPIVDPIAKTLTFSADIYDAGFFINGTLCRVANHGNSRVVSLENPSNSSLAKLLFNPSDGSFSMVSYSESVSLSEYVILGYVRYVDGKIGSIDLCFPYIMNGLMYGFEPKLFMQQPVSFLFGGDYPSVDTAAGTVSFPPAPYDTIVYVGDASYTRVVTEAGVSIDISQVLDSAGTSAWVLLLNPVEKTFLVTEWKNTSIYKTTHVIIATFRRKPSGDLSVWMPMPFYYNGLLYGHKVPTLNTLDSFVKGINHRGYYTAPENTLPAYTLSKKMGYAYVECDISWTSDGVPVLLHDNTIDRTSNGSGSVSNLTLDELKLLDFGSWKNPRYAGTRIPTFREFLLHCKKLSLHPYIEIKGTITNSQAVLLLDHVKSLDMLDKVSWISFGLANLDLILEDCPTARVGYLCSINTDSIASAAGIKTATNKVFLNVEAIGITEPLVQSALDAGLTVEAWTVNNPTSVQTIVEYGVSGITTDSLNVADVLGA